MQELEYGSPQWIAHRRKGWQALIACAQTIRSPKVTALIDELGAFDKEWDVQEIDPCDAAALVGLDVRELV